MLYDEHNNYYDYIFKETNKQYDYDLKETTNNFEIGNININNFRHKNNVTTPIDGLNKGNLFSDIYEPYKNYIYTIKVNGKREELLLKIQALCFALKDLELYLELHPNEVDKLKLFNEYQKEANDLKEQYSKEYNPITLKEMTSSKEFTWINNPWPWDKGGN